ncbi:MAG TPA: VOC family protein [Nitrospiria bacterium]
MTDQKPSPMLRGLRHLALRVSELGTARSFYEGLLGMTVVWQPDTENIYLTSGFDNLALHLMSPEDRAAYNPVGQALDHFGFVVGSPDDVRAMESKLKAAGVRIIKPTKQHRDGSVSFYTADPDGNVIQFLYEPNISPLRITKP